MDKVFYASGLTQSVTGTNGQSRGTHRTSASEAHAGRAPSPPACPPAIKSIPSARTILALPILWTLEMLPKSKFYNLIHKITFLRPCHRWSGLRSVGAAIVLFLSSFFFVLLSHSKKNNQRSAAPLFWAKEQSLTTQRSKAEQNI